MADSWEDSKKTQRHTGLIVVLCIATILLGLILFNNAAPFQQQENKDERATFSETAPPKQKTEPLQQTAVKEKTPQKKPGGESVVSEDAAKKETLQTETTPAPLPSAETPIVLDLPTVEGSLADTHGLRIRLSLRAHFKTEILEKEILFKRDNITVVIKKTLLRKNLADIVAENLRAELKGEINRLLENGHIDDIEFIDFQPVYDK